MAAWFRPKPHTLPPIQPHILRSQINLKSILILSLDVVTADRYFFLATAPTRAHASRLALLSKHQTGRTGRPLEAKLNFLPCKRDLDWDWDFPVERFAPGLPRKFDRPRFFLVRIAPSRLGVGFKISVYARGARVFSAERSPPDHATPSRNGRLTVRNTSKPARWG